MRKVSVIGIVLVLLVASAAAQTPAAVAPSRPEKWARPLEQEGLPNLFQVSPVLYRGAQPTAAGMKNLERMGIKTVVNLRALHSDEDELKGTALAAESIRFNTWNAEGEDVVRFLKIMADPRKHPVFVHCKHGSDRTGTMVAFYRIVFEGWSKDDAITEMTEGGFGFHSIWTNLPRYIRRANIERLRQEAGLAAPAPKPEATAGLVWLKSAPAKIELTKTEVTVAQYRACVEAGKCTAARTKDAEKRCNWGYTDRDQHPVNCVTWHQAKAFCEWVGGRLPTGWEWFLEVANGEPVTIPINIAKPYPDCLRTSYGCYRSYPWGDAEASCDYAVMSQDGEGGPGCGKGSTWPVCSKERGNSVSGLCDMSGNVEEWTSSITKERSKRPRISGREVVGGSWITDWPSLRGTQTNIAQEWEISYYCGFRCGRP